MATKGLSKHSESSLQRRRRLQECARLAEKLASDDVAWRAYVKKLVDDPGQCAMTAQILLGAHGVDSYEGDKVANPRYFKDAPEIKKYHRISG